MAATEPMTETGSFREGVSGPFIRHPVATTLLMVAILLVGVVAYPLLPVAPLPQIDFPTIVVSASLPGASPDTMASSVAQPLERQIAQIPGVTQMTSTSSLGATAITVQFDLDRNIDAAAGDIQGAINAASGQLPKILPSSPTYRKVNPADAPILILSLTSDTAPITEVDDVAENILAQQISQISGVSLVRIGGQQQPAIRVQIDPAKLVEKGLQLEDVRAQTRHRHRRQPERLDQRRRSSRSPSSTTTSSPSRRPWNDVIIAYRNGAPVRVRDVGQAVRGPADVYQAAWGNGKRDVFLVVFKVPGVNVIKTVEKVKATMARLQAAIPASMHIAVLSDRTTTIRASVEDVQFTLMLTIALVVMVIFVFLRNFWATVIPSFTVPLALLGACAMMWAASYSLDNLSLMALTIAVGFVVDDAIVVLENITRHVEHGMKPMQAALKGAGEIGFTVVSISMSLIAVLIPLLLMSGIIGRLFREFSVTLAMTIVVSAIVSLTLTPMLASRFLRDHTHDRHNKLYMLFERGFAALAKGYERGLDAVLAPPLHHLDGLSRHRRRDGRAVHRHSQGLLPAAGHRHPVRHLRRVAGHLVRRDGEAAGAVAAPSCNPTRTSRTSRWASAPASAPPRRTPAACSSPSSRARSAPPTRSRSSPGCGPSSPRSRARGCSCRWRRTSPSARAPPAPSSSTRCRTPISTS